MCIMTIEDLDIEELYNDIFDLLGNNFNYKICLDESERICNIITGDLIEGNIKYEDIKAEIVKYCKEVKK